VALQLSIHSLRIYKESQQADLSTPSGDKSLSRSFGGNAGEQLKD